MFRENRRTKLLGLAPNLGVLVAARALQAAGGAALSPASLSLLSSAFPDRASAPRPSASSPACPVSAWRPGR